MVLVLIQVVIEDIVVDQLVETKVVYVEHQ